MMAIAAGSKETTQYWVSWHIFSRLLLLIFITSLGLTLISVREVGKNSKNHQLLRKLSSEPQRIVFFKTFKTGSTTVAELIFTIAQRRRLYMLHPQNSGWFAKDEFQRHAESNRVFDVSFRHIHPAAINYNYLGKVFPGATLYITILRDPVSRFFSLFKFDTGVNKKYRDNPNKLVQDLLSPSLNKAFVMQKRQWFCNNQVRNIYSNEEDIEKNESSKNYLQLADRIIAELEAHNVLVLIQDYMAESFIKLGDTVGFDILSEGLSVPQTRKQNYQYGSKCGQDCIRGIEKCSGVDMAVYKHFKAKFEAEFLPAIDMQKVKDLKKKKGKTTPANHKNPYKANCIPQPSNPAERLQSCEGRLA